MPGASSEEIARLEALHAQNPGGRVFAHLAEAYRRAGQAARARELLRRGLADHPDYPSAHVVLGRVLEDLGEPEAAERSFARVLDLDPHNMIALRRLAAAADEGGRSEEALAHWTALAGLEPGDEFVEARIAALTAAVERTGPGPAAAFTRASLAETGDVPAPGGRDEEPDRAAGEWDPFDEEAAADSFDAVPAGHGVGASARESAASGDRTAEGDETGDAAFEDVAIGDPPLQEVPHDDVPFEDVSGEYVGLDDTPAEEVSDEDRALPSLPLMDLDAVELDFAPGAAEALAPPTGSLTPEDVGTAPAEGETAPSWPELDAGLIEELDGSDPAGTADSPPPDAGARSDPRGADWPEADARDHDLDEEFPGVETETLGDLYAAQGLHGRAAGVYRRLLRRNPADARLQAKLYEAESRVAGGEAEPVLPEWGDVAGARRPAAPPGSTAGRGPDAAPPFARAQETEPRAGRLEAAGPAEEPPAAEEPGAEASDEWPPLESPPEADGRPEEEPLTFAEPFAYGAGEDVRVGSAWAEPGAAAEAPGVFEGEPVADAEQDVPGALWTGEEFEGSVFAPGAPAGSAGEEVGTAGVDSAGGRTEGSKGAGEPAASVGAGAADTEDVPAYDAGMTQVAA